MLQGTYFGYDSNSSLGEGIVYYRYFDIIRTNLRGTETDYPVYVSFDEYDIVFEVQYREPGIGDNCIDGNYIHTELFRIPYSTNQPGFGNIKKALIESLYGCNKGWDLFEREYKRLSTNDNNDSNCYRSYFSHFSNKTKHKKWEKCLNCSSSSCVIEYRWLLLDFLFDFKHSTVFQNHPTYKKLEKGLNENPFLLSIISKAELFYHLNHKGYQENYTESIVGKCENDLTDVFENWLDLIFKPYFEFIINPELGWFDDVEHEHKKACQKYEETIASTEEPYMDPYNKKRHLLSNSIKWLASRHSFLNFITFDALSLVYLTLILIVLFFAGSQVITGDGLIKCVLIMLSILPCYLFVQSSILLISKKINSFSAVFGLMNIRFLIGIISLWFVPISSDELINLTSRLTIDFGLLLLLIFLVVIIFQFISLENRKVAPTAKKIWKRSILILFLGFCYSMIFGFFITGITIETSLKRMEINNVEKSEDAIQIGCEAVHKKDSSDKRLSHDSSYLEKALFLDGEKYCVNPDISNFQIDIHKNFDFSNHISNQIALTHSPKTYSQYISELKIKKIAFSFQIFNINLLVFPVMILFNSIVVLFISIFIVFLLDEKRLAEPI